MRIAKKISVLKEIEQTIDIKCNKCGNSCFPESSGEPYGLIEQVVSGGYYSNALEDMTQIRFSLCEKCVLELTKSFTIPHDIQTEYTPGFVPVTEQPKHLEAFEKSLKEYEEKLVKVRENFKKLKNN